MRQVDITILKSRLNYELKNLPFEIIKNGKVVGIVTENIKPDLKKSSPQKHKKKTTSTGWANPLENTVLAPKK